MGSLLSDEGAAGRVCLITGCEGFIGSYLAEFLLGTQARVYGTVYQPTKLLDRLQGRVCLLPCDMLDREALSEIVGQVKPDLVFHLAAQSLVVPSWEDPEHTLNVNVLGTFYLLESIKNAAPDALVEVVCSSSEYGLSFDHEMPIREEKELRPCSPYGVSKVGTDMMAHLYWHAYGLKVIRVRPFNITGPGKTFDACADFTKGIVEVAKGLRETLEVGNLEAIRDITDVRDAVGAMWLLAERGVPGEVYNICSGTGVRIGDLLERVLALAEREIPLHQNSARMRPGDEPIYVGDNSRLCSLGWKPRIPLQKTLADMLHYWRREIGCS